MPHVKGPCATTRTFGLEVETTLPYSLRNLYPIGRHTSGPNIPHYAAGWEGRLDGSLRSSTGYFPIEIVSPVLRGESGLTDVVYVLNDLADIGAQPNETCGMHVHIGVEDLTAEQVMMVKRAFIRYERAFYGVSGVSALQRVNSHYAKPSDRWTRSDIDDRYRALNLSPTLQARQNGAGKDTVEFRLWQSTTVDTTAITAISMAMALVCKVAEYGAKTHERIEDEKESIHTFCQNHFKDARYKIVADAPIVDILLHAWHEAKQASH